MDIPQSATLCALERLSRRLQHTQDMENSGKLDDKYQANVRKRISVVIGRALSLGLPLHLGRSVRPHCGRRRGRLPKPVAHGPLRHA